jgi:ATP-binding cassette subfamily B protein
VPLPRYPLAGLRRLFSVVFQDPVRYHFTLRENVLAGDVGRPLDATALARALELAGMGPVLRRLPRGEETLLGRWRRGGTDLSGGEWQRLALARGLYRRAPFLVLDEPVTGLDAEAEFRFFTHLRAALGDCGVLLISHRFTTIRQADYIYVLEGGRVVQEGTHDVLVREEGTYARLCQLQAQLADGEESPA